MLSVNYSCVYNMQVSFGEMIGCDKEDVSIQYTILLDVTYTTCTQCPIEWFHFQCVGLTSKPKGKW